MATGRRDLEAADRNLAAWFRLLARHSSGGLEEGDGYLLFAGAHEYPGTYTNGVIRTDTAGGRRISSAELLARADVFFGGLGRPYVTWVRTHVDDDLDTELRRRGHWPRPPADGSPLIWVRVHEGFGDGIGPDPDGVDLYESATDEDRHAFIDLVARGYGLAGADEDLSQALLFSLGSLQAHGVHVHVARLADTGMIGGGMVSYDAEGGVHLGWNVTDPLLRGRGIGRAVTRLAVRDAGRREAGFACGVASQMGVPIWLRMGFEVPTRYRRYVAPAPAPPAASGQGSRRTRRQIR